jgi:ankyrin repeat protein
MSKLFSATVSDDLEEVRNLIENGHNINETNNTGLTSLIVASDLGNLSMVNLLLENGAECKHK